MAHQASDRDVSFLNEPVDDRFSSDCIREPLVEEVERVRKRLSMDRADIEHFVANAHLIEEKNALNVVRAEAKETAMEWLKKKSGQHRIRTNVFLLLQQNSVDEDNDAITEDEAIQMATQAFIDDHMKEAVAEAQLEIDRERQAIVQELCGAMRRKSRTGTMNSIDMFTEVAR